MLRCHRTTRNGPMSFHRRPYLLPLYRDRSAQRVIRKSVQCGISELLIIDALESAERGLACLYVMPSQAKRDQFVANRVSKLIARSPGYRRRLGEAAGGANNLALKHFGQGVISFVGSNAESEFIEFPADLVIVDEFDRCCQEHLPLVRDRLAASPHKLAVFAGTPTFEDYAISKQYEASDAREWHLACPACGRRQPVNFFDQLVRQTGEQEYELLDREWAARHQDGPGRPPQPGDDLRLCCVQCRRPLDRLAQGEWVARHPGREVVGYQISQLFVPTVSLASIWADWQKAQADDFERQRFYNSVLGLPYTAPGRGLTLGELLACADPYALPAGAQRTTMGVDVGDWFHVRTSDHPQPGVRRAVFIGRVRTLAELDDLLARYDVQCCVVDAQPEARLVREWQQRHPRGRLWRCLYTDDDLRDLRRDAAEGLVRVARTPSLDAATDAIRQGRNRLPRNVATLDGGDFVAQMTAPIRHLVTDARGNRRYVWSKPAADHYRHADNYDWLAGQLWRPPAAAGMVHTDGRQFPQP
jgi:hypothetical protein